MRVIIKKDYSSCALWVADFIVRRISEFAPEKDRPFVLGLPTGSTPLGVYRELVKRHRQGDVSFQNVVTFNMDEYLSLDPDHPQSYHRFMRENLFSHIDIKPENINILDGMAKDPEGECRRYEEKIASYGKINLFLGGIGADGHIAFNEPGSSLSSRSRVKTLARDTILQNSRFFDGDTSKVPTRALTVGIGTIADAEEVVIIATGHSKARAVRHAVEGPVSQMWPASALQTHRASILVCDDDAIEELRVGTVRYFNDIEGETAQFCRND